MQVVDTHCHLTDSAFDADREAVLARATAAGVTGIVAIGTTLESSGAAVHLSSVKPHVFAAIGIHPNHAGEAGQDDWGGIVELARQPRVRAIGETGLDRYRSDTAFDVQVVYFERHLRLARDLDLPVVIHCRDAETDVLSVLERVFAEGPVRGVMHSFTGTAATAARCVALGLYISFAGQITFSNRKFDALREVVRVVPLDRVVVETDSPYLAPEPHRGERNEPAHVVITAVRIAHLRGLPSDEFAEVAQVNVQRLFGPMNCG